MLASPQVQASRERFLSALREDFNANGRSVELDDLDKLMVTCRRQRDLGGHFFQDPLSDERLQRAIEKARRVLSNMRPLSPRQHCGFCRNNNEHYKVYSTHVLKNELGEVACPILARYVCPMCGATGKKAHTIRYCPFYEGMGTAETLNWGGRPGR